MLNALTGQEITNDELLAISQMAHQQRLLEIEIEVLNNTLLQKFERLKSLSEQQIPDAMLAMGLSELKLSTGESLSIKKYYSASITPDHQADAFNWLHETGNDDIIKNNISLSFGKGEDERANKLASDLIKQGFTPEQKIFVHPMTLKAFVKERIETGAELPLDVFGVYVGNKTKITPAK